METIKVMLVEDDPIWREHLTNYLSREEDLIMVGSAANREDAIHLARLSDANIVLMDLVLTGEGYDGIEAALDIQEIREVKVIMLTGVDEEEAIKHTFAAGAINYVTKTHYEDIPCAIRAAYHNMEYIHPDSAGVIRREFRRLWRDQQGKLLTPSEKEILKRIHLGKKQRMIHTELHTAESTVKKHVNSILKKLGVRSSRDAARKAKRLGMLD